MLEEMRIRGLGVITDATLELDPGLTVVSGETGAGKTMVVTGLTLLLGGRADPGLVRIGQEQAVVEGRAILPANSPVRQAAQELGAELDDDTLIISRTVTAAGRSRAHVGGRSVPVGVLAELTASLLTIHGQSDQLRLLQPGQQRECLDRFGELAQPLKVFAGHFDRWRARQRELSELRESLAERGAEAESLRDGVAQIEQVNPQPGEDHALRAEDLRLAHADGLLAAAHEARAALSGDGSVADGVRDVSSLLADARAALQQVSEHDTLLADLGQRLDEISYLAADVAGELASYAAGIDVDPARLAEVQQRRAQLTGLTRKYG
ncbi:MAG: AAA family ATPase, partial [Angustibacter sp.]